MNGTIIKAADRYENGQWKHIDETVVIEKEVKIFINEAEYAAIVCSPWELDEMITGFLYSRGVIADENEIMELNINEAAGEAHVLIKDIKKSADIKKKKDRASVNQEDNYSSQKLIDPEDILLMAQRLEENSKLFKKTGGVHSAALTDGADMWIYRMDVGRHNTLDRIMGYCLKNGIDMEGKYISFSGRVPAEIIIKTAKMGCSLIVSPSAPTNLGLDIAEKNGITVAAFTRNGKFNMYTHPERISK